MAWFIGQSLVIIAAAFLLGLLVGWLWWGLVWRRTRPDESTVLDSKLSHEDELAERDAEIVRLRILVERCDQEHAAAAPALTPVPVPIEAAAESEPVAVDEPEPIEEREPVAVDEPQPEAAKRLEPAAVAMPLQATPIEDAPADDLKRIEGIGPQMSGALNRAGIRTFAQLAEADVDRIRAAIEAAGLRFAPSLVTWSRQARLLADRDEEGFADLTRRLVAGRDEGRV